MRRAVGATSYFRVQPPYQTTKPRPVKRENKPIYIVKELPMTVDVTSPEVQETDRLNRKIDLAGQAIIVLVVVSGALVLAFQIGRWLGWW